MSALKQGAIEFPGGSWFDIKPGQDGVQVALKISDDDDQPQIIGALLGDLKQVGVDVGGGAAEAALPASREHALSYIDDAMSGGPGKVMLGHSDTGRIFYGPSRDENGNMALIGAPGEGKTTMMKNMYDGLDGIRVVLDPGGDMGVPGETLFEFNLESNYGINPLVVGTDPKNGGPQIQTVIMLEFMSKQFQGMGDRQRDVVRRILNHLYSAYGITDDHNTWMNTCPDMGDVIAFVKFLDTLRHLGYFDNLKKIRDLNLIRRIKVEEREALILKVTQDQESFIEGLKAKLDKLGKLADAAKAKGPDAEVPKEIQELEDKLRDAEETLAHLRKCEFTNPEIAKIERKLIEIDAALKVRNEEVEKARAQDTGEHTLKTDVVINFADYADEFQGTSQQIQSVMSYMELLSTSGIFGPNMPDISEPGVYRFELVHLEAGPRQLLVETMLRTIMRERQRIGHQNWVHPIYIFHDEARDQLKQYSAQDTPMRVAQQGRKYGIRYIIAGHSENTIPGDMRTSFRYKVIMGLGSEAKIIKEVARLYGIPEDMVRRLRRGLALIADSGDPFRLYNTRPYEARG